MAHQNELKQIFDTLPKETKLKEEAEILEKKNKELFESLLKDFRKFGSGTLKFSRNKMIETLFRKRKDLRLEKNDTECTICHNIYIFRSKIKTITLTLFTEIQ